MSVWRAVGTARGSSESCPGVLGRPARVLLESVGGDSTSLSRLLVV